MEIPENSFKPNLRPQKRDSLKRASQKWKSQKPFGNLRNPSEPTKDREEGELRETRNENLNNHLEPKEKPKIGRA